MISSQFNLSMVFARTNDWSFAREVFTMQKLRLLSSIDGKATIAELVEKLEISYEQIFTDLQYLHALRLIKVVPLQKASPGVVKEKKVVQENSPKYRDHFVGICLR